MGNTNFQGWCFNVKLSCQNGYFKLSSKDHFVHNGNHLSMIAGQPFEIHIIR